MKKLSISSPDFTENGNLPQKYTCDGLDVNPPLIFENVPHDTRSLTLIVEDPDSPGKTWLHWVVFNIDPTTNFVNANSVPSRGVQSLTDFGKSKYGGPCPQNGIHKYKFKLFALDTVLDLTEDVTLEEIMNSMNEHIIDKAEISALYTRER